MKRIRFKGKTRSERGQSLVLVAFSIFALVAFVGLAIDVGLSYVDRVRARRAADAAALAAASELPLEAAAQARALEYLEANGYPCGLQVQNEGDNLLYQCSNAETRVEINAGYPESYIAGPGAAEAKRVIVINTTRYRDDVYASNTADRIEVIVQQASPLYFMRIFGFDSLHVEGRAVAENINNLDVVIVYDTSGSMEFDTLCYGCWSPQTGAAYPEGNRWRLPWKGPANGPPAHCSGSAPYTSGGYTYIIIEAEEYSSTNVPYDRDAYVLGMSYWVMQRNGSQSASWHIHDGGASGALGRDSYGAYITHMPYYVHSSGSGGTGVNCNLTDLLNGGICNDEAWVLARGGPYPAPRVDYDVTIPSSGTWYVWVRAQGGTLMWGLDGNTPVEASGFPGNGPMYDGARPGSWKWKKLGSLGSLTANSTHTLHLWAGDAGFDVDRIIITTNSTNDSSQIPVKSDTTHIDNNRTGAACDPCDARFGGYPGGEGWLNPPNCVLPGFPADAVQNYRYLDDIYDDEQPIRSAVEAAKRFVARMDPQYDQIGLVSYSADVITQQELQCIRWSQSQPNTPPCNATVITNTVIASLDGLHANGNTAIPGAIRRGINVLSNTSGHYGRPGAAHIMVLMTDGEANDLANTTSVCYAQDYWPHNTGDTDKDRAKDCMVYYARQARNNGIVIYTITLGAAADIEIMDYVAQLTGGIHRNAPRPEQLDPIFDELYKRIFLRLVE